MENLLVTFDAKLPGLYSVDFLVVFSQWQERDAFKELCSDAKSLGQDTIGYIHRMPMPSTESYRVALVVSGQGNINSYEATNAAILRLRPRAVILAGICAGPKETGVREGDILIPRWIIPYELAKQTKTTQKLGDDSNSELNVEMRDFPYDVSQRLWKDAEALAHDVHAQWSGTLREQRPDGSQGLPDIHLGEQSYVGSGEKNIATELSPNSRALARKIPKGIDWF